jgi:hypothetical protein
MKWGSFLLGILSVCVFFTAISTGLHVYAEVTASSSETSSYISNSTYTTWSGATTSSGAGTTLTTSSGTSGESSTATTSGSEYTQPPPSITVSYTAPIIRDVYVGNVASYAAKILWKTDQPSDSRVGYGTSYGSYSLSSVNRCDGGGLVVSHCVYISDLQPETHYYFVVASKNSAGLPAYSSGHMLTTLANPETSSDTLSGFEKTESAVMSPVQSTSYYTSTSLISTSTYTNESAVPAYTSGVRILEETSALVPQPTAPVVNVIKPASSTAIVPPSALETSRTQLEYIGTTVRTFQSVLQDVHNDVQYTVSRDVERVFNEALTRQPAIATDGEHVFDPVERTARLEELRRALDDKQQQLSEDVQTALTSNTGENPLPNIESVLKSSLEDIALLIQGETGVRVDLSPTARTVIDEAQEKSEQFNTARQALRERDGLDLYTDTDRDGISNYDEVHIYKTDPRNSYSSGGSLTDGEKVVLGFDVSTSTIRRVPVESPIISGEEARDVFEVYAITVHKPESVATDTPALPLPEKVEEKVTFEGRALPNSFVTLYIFSTPIVVTVKTDITGAWKYTLDTELPNGEHNLYVATVDAGGKILAKSPSIPFVKTAEAADFIPLIITETPDTDPLDILRNNLMLIAFVGFGLFAIVVLAILGIRRESRNEQASV